MSEALLQRGPSQRILPPGEWHPLEMPGQIVEGDRIRFRLAGRGDDSVDNSGGKLVEAVAARVIHAGDSREEVVYNTRKNHYFIVRMALDGTSSHRDVEFLPRRPTLAPASRR